MNNTSHLIDFKTEENEFNRISPIPPLTLNLLGSFLTIMLILGVSFNGILLLIFKRNNDLRTPLNVLIIAITFLNLIGCITELPWIIHSSFSHRYFFNYI